MPFLSERAQDLFHSVMTAFEVLSSRRAMGALSRGMKPPCLDESWIDKHWLLLRRSN